MAKWYFQKHDGFSDITQSSSAEAFSGGSIRDLATAIVREGVQNLLDARSASGDGSPVHLRLSLGKSKASPGDIETRWFGELMDHVRHKEVGAPNPPESGEACEYLAFEDFGTKGLIGNYAAPYEPGKENNFVNFMYHDGVTGKADSKLGSRGVGKIVFTMASRARTIFAFTIREDDPSRQPLLVGKNALKFRKLGDELFNGRSYFLDGWPQNQARQPVSTPPTLQQFVEDFPVKRKSEPGLSIVIPFIDPSVTAKDVRHAVVNEYYYALLSGRLVVELDDHGTIETLDHNLPQLDDPDLNAEVALAKWAISQPNPALKTVPPKAKEVQRLTEELVPEELRKAVTAALNHRTRQAVRLSLNIHPKKSDPVLAEFDVYLEFAERFHAKPTFVRDLLPVSDVREAKAAPQVRALVIIHAGPLAEFLRAAEGANHTDWSPRTDEFQERYVGRRGEIAFVAQSVAKLIEIARGQANEPVGGISTQFFSAADPKAKPDSTTKDKNKGKGDKPEKPEIEEGSREAAFIVDQTGDGFSIKHNPGQPLPKRLTVRVAYDVLRGSPWGETNYDPADFDFRKVKGIVRVVTGGEVDVDRPDPGNRLIIYPKAEDFEVIGTGFDPNRDLIVDVRDTSKPRKKAKVQNVDQSDELHEPQQADA